MITITKQFRFEAAHTLPNHSGSCKNLHGHSYLLEVEIGGVVNKDEKSPSYGMIMDFGDLKKIVKEKIIDKLDHTNLNDLGIYPTAENLVGWIYFMLKEWAEHEWVNLVRIRLYETVDSYAEWRKDASLFNF